MSHAEDHDSDDIDLGRAATRTFLARHDLGDARYTRVPGGRNNRVYRVEATTPGVATRQAALKVYFQHADDPRDRLGAEVRFLEHARACGVRAVPALLGVDRAANATLLEWIDGVGVRADSLGTREFNAAVEFVAQLQQAEAAPSLPDASEACFTLEEHGATVERRVAQLQRAIRSGPDNADLHDFVQNRLAPFAHAASLEVRMRAGRDQPLLDSMRCVSPSDFGFHNAIVRRPPPSDSESVHRTAGDDNARITFIDFEYAGWDDPAKLICDFMSQPEVPIPEEWHTRFAGAIAELFCDPQAILSRVELLRPLYRVKWCCILLNPVVAIGRDRRAFADSTEALSTQLTKARRLL